MNIKKIVHKLIAMHLESIKAWQPNKFVALDLVTADWTDADFERARIAQEVADDRLRAWCQYCHLNYDASEKYRRACNKATKV